MKVYIRSENNLIKNKLIQKVSDIEKRVDDRSTKIEGVVGDLSDKLAIVNTNLEDKLDAMTQQFEDIKSMIEVIANPSQNMGDENNLDVSGGELKIPSKLDITAGV